MGPEHKGFNSPNFTQSPNDWFDEMLPEMSLAETKVTAVLIRHTFGFHRRRVEMGLARLAKLSGLSENSVIAGAHEAEQRGIVRRLNTGTGDRRRTVWELVITTSASEVVTETATSASEVALPQPARQTTSASEGREIKTKQTRKKPLKTATDLTTARSAAVENVIWEIGALSVSAKLPKARREQLAELNHSGGPFVANYLYALAHSGFRKPALWAASQITDNPTAWQGQPFDTLARLGPAGLAGVLAWMRDDGAYPLNVNGATGAALAFRAHMQGRYAKEKERLFVAIDDAITDLGLSELAPEVAEPEHEPLPPVAELPESDGWQLITDQLKHEVSKGVFDRLRHCKLVTAGADGIVIAAPSQPELDWLQNRMGKMLAQRFGVSLRLEEA